MGIRRGEITTKIVSDGLVFNMDAANRASTIPSTSTTKTFNTVDTAISGTLEAGTDWTNVSLPPNFHFDGTDDFINCGNHSSLQITGELTVSIWFKTTSVAASYGEFIAKDNSSDRCWNMAKSNSARNGFFTVRNGGSAFGAYSNASDYDIGDGNWHNIIGVYLPSTYIRLYLDGTQLAEETTSIPSSIDNDSVPLSIGARSTPSNEFFGQISCAHIYNRALSAEEVLSNYNGLRGRFGV